MRATECLNARPLPQKIFFAFILLIGVLVAAAMLYRSFSLPMVPLFAQTTPDEAVQMIDYLDETGAVYAFDEAGRIVVPGKDADRLREALVTAGVCKHTVAAAPEGVKYSLPQRALQLLLIGVLAAVLWLFVVLGWQIYRELRKGDFSGNTEAEGIASNTAELGKTVSEVMPDVFQDKNTVRLKLSEQEHPQVVTVYLLSTDTEQSVSLLEAMPAAQRRVIWRRMSMWKGCEEALRRQVVSMFEAKAEALEHSEGFEKIKAIFLKLSSPLQREMLQTFSEDDAAEILRTELAVLMHSGKL